MLVVCKECGKSYSNKANACPECACPTSYNYSSFNCIECGTTYDYNEPSCPVCACPTEVSTRMKKDAIVSDAELNINIGNGKVNPAGFQACNLEYTITPGVPWKRFFARMMDMAFWGMILGYSYGYILARFLGFYLTGNDQIQNFVFTSFSTLTYLIIEPLLIIATGTTLFKHAMGLKIMTNLQDTNYSYHQLLKRNLNLFLSGLGAQIPLAQIITLIIAYRNMKSDILNRASWDITSNTVVMHKTLTAQNYGMIIVLLVLLLAMASYVIAKSLGY